MEFTYENQGINTFLVWKMEEKDVLDELIKGMAENNEIAGLLPLTFSQNNRERYIKYNISSKVTLKQYLSGMVSKSNFINAMLSLVNAILELDDYMIEKEKLLLDMEYIYINVGTAQVGLAVLPVENISEETDLAVFFRNIMFHVQFDQNENGNYIAAVLNFLNNGNPFSMTDFKKLLEEQLGEKKGAAESVIEKVESKKVEPSQSMAFHAPQQPLTFQQPAAGNVSQQPAAFHAPQQPATFQVSQQPAAAPAAGAQPSKKKDKFSLFGKKKKEPEPKVKKEKNKKKGKSPSQQPVFQGGFAIPGQTAENVSSPQNGISRQPAAPAQQFGVSQQPAAPAQQFGVSQQPAAPGQQPVMPQQPVMQEVNMNFGETTVLTQTAAETTVLAANMTGAELKPYILRKKNNQKAFINKNEFRIGKEVNYVDFCIMDNLAVSRSHADIITRNGAYFIRDNNSLNHTFLDGRQLQGGVEVQLENGVKFKLADEDFEFWLY